MPAHETGRAEERQAVAGSSSYHAILPIACSTILWRKLRLDAISGDARKSREGAVGRRLTGGGPGKEEAEEFAGLAGALTIEIVTLSRSRFNGRGRSRNCSLIQPHSSKRHP